MENLVKLDKSLDKFFSFIIGLLLTITSIITSTLTLSYLWLWFVVPLGVSTLGFAQAFGLTLLVTFFQVRNKPMFKPDVLVKRKFTQRIWFAIGMALSSLTIGYITQLFM